MGAKVPQIIGLPGGWKSGYLGGPDCEPEVDSVEYMKLVTANLPILQVQVCKAEYSKGMELYKLITAMDEYAGALEAHEITLTDTTHLNIACHNLTNPSESYSNSFSPNSVAEQASNIGTEAMQDISFITGKTKIAGDDSLLSAIEDQNGLLGSLAGGINEQYKKAQAWAQSDGGNVGLKRMINKMMDTANHMGSRLDFPLMWRSSNYSASYNITTRLFNPIPASDKMYENFIVGPLGAILMLGLPRSDDGDLYQWPFLHSISIPGLFRLMACYVSNITVSKGGDSVDISALVKGHMRPNMIDVQITFTSLYNVMPFVMDASQQNEFRPTLLSELDALRDCTGHQNAVKAAVDKYNANNPGVNEDDTSHEGLSPEDQNVADNVPT